MFLMTLLYKFYFCEKTSLKGFSKQFQNLHEEISNKTGIIEDKSVIIAKLCNVIHQMVCLIFLKHFKRL